MGLSWFNSDASEFRTFLADLIDAEIIEDLDDVRTLCDRPQKYNKLYTQWVENDYDFPDEVEEVEGEE